MSNQEKTLLKKANTWGLAAVFFAVMISGPAAYAVTTVADSWRVVDVSGQAEVTQPSAGAVQAKFTGGQVPGYAAVLVRPESADTSKSFTGNYSAAKVSSVQFTLTVAEVAPGYGSGLILRSNGRKWKTLSVRVADIAGQPSVNRISMDRSAGGWFTTASGDTAAMWSEDIENVESLDVCLVKRSAVVGQQAFVVSGFSLDSDRAVGSLSPLEAALLARFNVTRVEEVSASDAAADSDGDGITDLEQILAANEPGYFEKNLFKVELGESDAGGITITWKAVSGHSYSVLRYDSMSDVTGDLVCGPQMAAATDPAQPVVIMSYKDVDAASGVQYFYRVLQD